MHMHNMYTAVELDINTSCAVHENPVGDTRAKHYLSHFIC